MGGQPILSAESGTSLGPSPARYARISCLIGLLRCPLCWRADQEVERVMRCEWREPEAVRVERYVSEVAVAGWCLGVAPRYPRLVSEAASPPDSATVQGGRNQMFS